MWVSFLLCVYRRVYHIRRDRAATTIQRHIRGWLKRTQFGRIKLCVLGLQARARGLLARRRYQQMLYNHKVLWTWQKYAVGMFKVNVSKNCYNSMLFGICSSCKVWRNVLIFLWLFMHKHNNLCWAEQILCHSILVSLNRTTEISSSIYLPWAN